MKYLKVTLITAMVTVILISATLYVLYWLFKFPQNYPDEMLKIETGVREFLYEITLPIKLARLSGQEPDASVLMPVYGSRKSGMADTWGAARDEGRTHEGQDIFAVTGTPVFSGTYGYVIRIRTTDIGGNYVMVAGRGGRRYYYAHLDRFPQGLKVGQEVTIDTVIGFVGNTGNAETTPPHLHFGVYENREAINPYPLLNDR